LHPLPSPEGWDAGCSVHNKEWGICFNFVNIFILDRNYLNAYDFLFVCNILFMKLKPPTEAFVMIKTTCPSGPSGGGRGQL